MKRIFFCTLTLTITCLFGSAALALPKASLLPGGEKAVMFSDGIGDYSLEVAEIIPREGDDFAVENGRFLLKGLFGTMTYAPGEKVTSSPRLFLRFHNIETNVTGQWVEAPRFKKGYTDCTISDSAAHKDMKEFECPFYVPTDGLFKTLSVEVIVAAVGEKEPAYAYPWEKEKKKKISLEERQKAEPSILLSYKHSPSFFITFDYDDDGVLDENDNCLKASNADQADSDGNGVGDACEEKKAADDDPCAENPEAEGCMKPDEPAEDDVPDVPESDSSLDDSGAGKVAKEDVTSCSLVANGPVNPFFGMFMAVPLLLVIIRKRRQP